MLDIEEIFSYHAPTPNQIVAMQEIRDSARKLALTIMANCPSSPDRTTAIRYLREAVMTANASIVVPTVATIP